MEQAQVQIMAVTGKGTSKGTIYEVNAGDGRTYSTWDGNLAAQANALSGQLADLRFEHKQNFKNGQTFDNYYLKELAPAGQLPASAVPVQQGTTVATNVPPNGAAGIPMQEPPISPKEKELHIIRQNVLGTAFAYGAQTGLEPDACFELAGKLFDKVYAKPVVTPQSVAAEVPGVTVGVPKDETTGTPVPEW